MTKENNQQNLLLIILALGFVIVAGAMFFAPNTINLSTGNEQIDTMNVQGSSKISVTPDEAEIYVNIEVIKPTARTAQQSNAQLVNQVKEALLNKGINEKQIETDYFYINPYSEWDYKTGERLDKGYKAIHSMKITSKDIDGLGELIDTAINAGATGVNRVNFMLSDDLRKQVNEEALKEASTDAKEKAESITSALNVKLGKIAMISESNSQYNPYVYYPGGRMDMAAESSKEYDSTSISPQNVDVTAYISINYYIN